MPSSQFTIYMLNAHPELDFNEYVEEIVEIFNDDIQNENETFLPKESNTSPFAHAQNYKVYTRAAKTTPDWVNVLTHVVTDLGDIKNINHSYVIFIEMNQEIFAVTGGAGFHLIDSVKKHYFGLELLSRVMDQDDNFIRKVDTRYITGNKLSGETQFINNVNIILEQNLDNIFKDIQSDLPIELIKEKFGLNITINKTTYSFKTKDSIKLGKSLTANQLDTLLFNISGLMDEEPGYPILPFRFLDKNNPLINDLDIEMAKQFIDYKDNNYYSDTLMLLPFYSSCEEYYAKHIPGPQSQVSYTEKSELLDTFNNFHTHDIEPADMLETLKAIKLSGVTEGSTKYNKTFYEHIDVKVFHGDKQYWLTDGEWCLLESEFIESLDNTYEQKINDIYDNSSTISGILPWVSGSEGEYNFSHMDIPNIYVLDKILVEQIEMCDLLIEEDDQLYFVHVKDGIDGDVRMLSNQITHAMQLLKQVFDHNSSELENYYISINQKINENDNESMISIAARKFIDRFQDVDSFCDYITSMKDKITFVFAVRPKPSHNLTDPSTIRSTAAKLSIIHLINQKQDTNFTLEFLQIDNTNGEPSQITMDELLAI